MIASAGALHTPALLLRSGLNHPLIGRHLALHPVIGLAGLFGSDTLNKYYSEGEKGNNSTVAQLSRDQQCNNLTTTGLSFGVSSK